MRKVFLSGILRCFSKENHHSALVDLNGSRATSYADLQMQIRKIIPWLQTHNLEDHDRVGINISFTKDYIALEIALWIAGYCAVPLGGTMPEKRVREIEDHCSLRLIVEEDMLDEIDEMSPLDWDTCLSMISDDDYVGMILYTSGSQGVPKGIMNTFTSMYNQFGYTDLLPRSFPEYANFASGAPFYFIASFYFYLRALSGGATYHILDAQINRDMKKMQSYICEHDITHVFISPAALPFFKNTSSTLETVYTGSEKLSNQCGRDGYELINVFGMSEVAGAIVTYKVDKPYQNTPIGRSNVEWCLFNDEMRPVPAGEEGELCFKGRFCEGYLGDKEKTEALYRGGWFHTGDIVRERADGMLVYVNRKDWMCKINGQRVEPGEIEQIISGCTGVERVVVKAFERNNSYYLCAFYQGDAARDDIKIDLQNALPSYMVPAYIVKVDAFEYLPNGKINRKVLQPPALESVQRTYHAPQNDLEKRICQAFAEQFSLERVSVDDDFFLLGGDSIGVLQLQERLSDLPLSSSMISQAKTPAALAAALKDAARNKDQAGGLDALLAHDNVVECPLSQTQLGIYFDDVKNPGRMIYNIPSLIKLSPEVDLDRFARAVETTLSAHAAFYVRIGYDKEGQPLMSFDPHEHFEINIEVMDEKEWELTIPCLVQPFNLEGGRLFSVRLIRTSDQAYVFLDFHHIVFDGASMKVFMEDVNRAYAGESLDRETYTLFDIVKDEKVLRESVAYDRARTWNREQFEGIDADTSLERDRWEDEITYETFDIDLGINRDEFEAFCKRAHISPNVYMVGLFGYLLGVYTNSEEAFFSSIHAGRHDMRSAHTIAMCVKTIPVYCRWTQHESLRQYCLRLKDQLMGSVAHDAYSYAEILSHLDCAPNVSFLYQGSYLDIETIAGAPYKVESLPHKGSTGFALTGQVFYGDSYIGPARNGSMPQEKGCRESYILHLEYWSNYYSRELIEAFAHAFKAVVQSGLMSETVSDVEVLDERLQEQFHKRDEQVEAYESSETVLDRFLVRASEQPKEEAVRFKDTTYTYGEVAAAARHLAGTLVHKGVKAGDVVGILIPRGPGMLIASVAAIQAGCAYVPLDATYPPSRLEYMLKDANASVLISTSEMARRIDVEGLDVLHVDQDGRANIDELAGKDEVEARLAKCKPKPEDLCVLLYTSGSTGVPKGVRLLHRNLASFIDWYVRRFKLVPGKRLATYASYGFDANLQDIFAACTSGATLVVIPEEIRLDLSKLTDYMNEHKVTHCFMTTQVGRQFASMGGVQTLEHLNMGGEALVPFELPSTFKCYNGYGPTECCACSTLSELSPEDDKISIGEPVPYMRAYVVGKYGERVPPGALGELWLSGPQTADGYLNLPEKTSEAFLCNPFSGKKYYTNVYRTGDVVRMRTTGEYDFIGRSDRQVKIRGFRIELTEVEACIRACEGVDDVAVIDYDNPDGGKSIAGYYVSSTNCDVSTIRDYIGEHKPSYMIPASLIQVDQIPLTQNGKVDRRALPDPQSGLLQDLVEYVAPTNEMEKTLCDAFATLFGLDKVSIKDDFFALGGDSVRIIKLQKLCDIPALSASLIFEKSTPEAIAKALMENDGKSADDSSAYSQDYLDGQTKVPLTTSQLGIYIESMQYQGELIYHIPALFKLSCDACDASRLAKAVQAVLQAHPFMATKLDLFDDSMPAMVYPKDPQSLPAPSVQQVSDEEFEKIRPQLMKPFDLLGEPLYRIEIYKTPTALYLFMDMHHLIFDGSSMQVFMDDLRRAYDGEALELEPFNGMDLALEESARRESAEFEEAKEWHKDTFFGLDVDSKPLRDVYNDEDSYAKATLKYPGVASALRTFCDKQGFSENVVAVGAFAYALGTYANAKEALFTTIYNGRGDMRTEKMIDMLVRTLPFYAQWTNETTVEDYLKKVNDCLLGAMRYSLFSFSDLAKEMTISSDILFAYQGDRYQYGGVFENASMLEVAEVTRRSLLDLQVFVEGDDLVCELCYRTNHYSKAYIEAFGKAYTNILSAFTTCASLSEVKSVDADDKQALLDMQGSPRPHFWEGSIVDAFAEAAKLHPQNDAIIFNDSRMTYAELDAETSRLAKLILDQQEVKGKVVSILVPRGFYMVIATLGALKAGAAYQPLDSAYPPERLNYMVEDAGAELVITTRSLIKSLDTYQGNVIILDDIDLSHPLPNEEDGTQPLIELPTIHPEDLFTLLYTSGSTGLPKGVRLTHGNIMTFIDWYVSYYDLRPESHVGAYASYGFDANMMDMYPALCTGSTIVIVDESMRLNLPEMQAYFNEHKVTHSFMTTQVGRQFALMGASKYIKHLSMGGESLVPFEVPEGFECYNAYGPTECTIYSTIHHLKPGKHKAIIGKPLDELRAYVLDDQMRMVPLGALGELVLAGPQVADGYLNRPEKTKEVFIDNPIEDLKDYQRAYRTGDIVRFLSDGSIDYIGRSDRQVKIRGFRIELPEVEECIRACEGIENAAVIDYDNPDGGKSIAGYYVSSTNCDAHTIREYIGERKPSYMIPASLIQVDSIPLNQNGKVDRRALPDPLSGLITENVTYEPPTNDIEASLCEAFSTLFGVDKVSINDDFFALGGDSIRIIKLQQLCDFPALSASLIFEKSTPKAIAKALMTKGSDGEDDSSAPSRDYLDGITLVPLSTSQLGIYIESMQRKDELLYHIASLFKFDKELCDAERLAKAVQEVLHAHPFLGITLDTFEDGMPAMVYPKDPTSLPAPSITSVSDEDFEKIRAGLARPFNLEGGALYRIEIYETPSAVYLFMDIHHLIFDGSSLLIFMEDLLHAYEGDLVEPETYNGMDLALEERERRQSEEFEVARKWHKDTFLSIDVDSIPMRDVYEKTDSFSRLNLRYSGMAKELHAFSEEQGISENVTAVGAFAHTLGTYTNAKEALFATIFNGRGDMRTSRTIDMLVKTLPMYAQWTNETTVADYLQSVNEHLLKTMRYSLFSFSDVAKELSITSDILFVYQGDRHQYGGIFEKASMLDVIEDTRGSLLDLQVFVEGDDLICELAFRDNHYSKEYIQAFSKAYIATLKAIISCETLGEIDCVDESDKQEILDLLGDPLPHVWKGSIVDAFTEAARLHPDNEAIIFNDERMTYAELDIQSTRLAKLVSERQETRGGVVSVLVPRGCYMIIATLAALKAGSAYQPLDSAYPSERLNYMVEDSGASLVITTRSLCTSLDKYTGEAIILDDVDLTSPLPGEDQDSAPLIELPQFQEDDLFTLLYTSGSTGLPKGVRLTQGNIMTFIKWYTSYHNLRPESRVGAYASYGFDANMMDMYPALCMGSTIVVVDETMRLNLPEMQNYFNEHKVTHAFMTTQVGRQFAIMGGSKYLKHLSMGGEALVPFEVPEEFACYNGYGPTECTIFSTIKHLEPGNHKIFIGKPLDEMRAYVLDEKMRMVPLGALGELVLAGPQVANGYLNRPEKTKEVFIDNPIEDLKDYKRAYRTGDIVRMLADGTIDYIGRSDRQVKIRGFRIELPEVEAVIRDYEGISDATVVARSYKSGGKYLAAFVVSDTECDIEGLKAFIGERKPGYMIPQAFMQIDKIPLTQNGKVNQRALPDIKPSAAKEVDPPKNDLEKMFVDMFKDILEIEEVGATEEFFSIGGTSLSAIRITMEAKKHGYEISYADIFERKTPRRLAELCQDIADDKEEEADAQDASSYNYEPLNAVLAENNLENFLAGEPKELGNVLLTGATGYLGIHILRGLIDNFEGKIYCLLRSRGSVDATARLKHQLFYYFENNFDELFETRLEVIEGDILNDLSQYDGLGINTVINAAAIVKHFSSGNEIEEVNTHGVSNLIDYCERNGASLVQISTYSTIETAVEARDDFDGNAHEQILYFGQDISNQYIHSKFMAERNILEHIAAGKLEAKIMRVGNLSPRQSDGEFQINFSTNASMGRLRSFVLLGAAPYDQLDTLMEFSAIDEVAQAVLTLSTTPSKCVLFHPFNHHRILLDDVLSFMKEVGLTIDLVERKDFTAILDKKSEDPHIASMLTTLLAYDQRAKKGQYIIPRITNVYTMQLLYRLGFHWSLTSHTYVEQFLELLEGIGFFDEDF